jgi:hypothetical protein
MFKNALRRGIAAALGMLLTFTVCGSALAAPAPASDIAPDLTDQQIEELSAFLIEYGVAEDVASDLIAQFDEGTLWDSMDDGVKPVSTVTEQLGNTNRTIETYADGSIAVSETSVPTGIPEGSPAPRSVSACTLKSGNNYQKNYTNCRADVNLGLIRMGFYFDYTSYNGGGGKITGYRSSFYTLIGGAFDNHRLERISQSAVRYSADASVAFKGFPVGWTCWMQANVDGTHAWTTHN